MAAQSLGRGFAEHGLVGAREAPELEEPVIGGDGGDRPARAVGVGQGAPHLGEPCPYGAAFGAHAAHVVERVAQAALADARHTAELREWERFAEM
jgi:hypothetical protein